MSWLLSYILFLSELLIKFLYLVQETYSEFYDSLKIITFENKFVYCGFYNKKTGQYTLIYNYDNIFDIILCLIKFKEPTALTQLDPLTSELIMVYEYVLDGDIQYQIGDKSVKVPVIYAQFSDTDLTKEFELFGYNSNIPGLLYAKILFYYKFYGKSYILNNSSDLKILIDNHALTEQNITNETDLISI